MRSSLLVLLPVVFASTMVDGLVCHFWCCLPIGYCRRSSLPLLLQFVFSTLHLNNKLLCFPWWFFFGSILFMIIVRFDLINLIQCGMKLSNFSYHRFYQLCNIVFRTYYCLEIYQDMFNLCKRWKYVH